MAGTRAFTRAGEVVLPIEEGPFERPQTRALLAHELMHAAQQRALGPSLPAEDSADGMALEAVAAAAQRRVLGHEAAAGPPLLHAAASPAAGGWPAAPPGSPAAAPIQREIEPPAHPAAAGNASGPAAPLPWQEPAAPGSGRPVPLGAAAPGIAAPAGATAHPATTDARPAAGAAPGEKRLLDLDDSKAVDELTDGIYKKVHARLRHELLVDRERSGLLSDFR